MSSIRKSLWLLSFLVCASVVNAQAIFVQNHDFEAPVLSPGGYTLGVLPGWSGSVGANWGAFHPTVGTWGYAAPSGNQLFYANGLHAQQVLPELAVAGRSYYLVVDVVNRPVYGSLDYEIELWAGTTLLASDYGSLAPPAGGSLESRLFVTVAPEGPAVGHPLAIRLGGANQVNFDDVRLVPEPALSSGLAAGVLLAGLARPRAGGGTWPARGDRPAPPIPTSGDSCDRIVSTYGPAPDRRLDTGSNQAVPTPGRRRNSCLSSRSPLPISRPPPSCPTARRPS